jgi:hypothetical protein
MRGPQAAQKLPGRTDTRTGIAAPGEIGEMAAPIEKEERLCE